MNPNPYFLAHNLVLLKWLNYISNERFIFVIESTEIFVENLLSNAITGTDCRNMIW
jgi:hypothetical protein